MPINSKLFFLERIRIALQAFILLKIGSEEIESEDQVKLVGPFIDNKLSYDESITTCLKQVQEWIQSNDLGTSCKKIKRKYHATLAFYHI